MGRASKGENLGFEPVDDVRRLRRRCAAVVLLERQDPAAHRRPSDGRVEPPALLRCSTAPPPYSTRRDGRALGTGAGREFVPRRDQRRWPAAARELHGFAERIEAAVALGEPEFDALALERLESAGAVAGVGTRPEAEARAVDLVHGGGVELG